MNWRTIVRTSGVILGVFLVLRTVFNLGRSIGYNQAVHKESSSTAEQDEPNRSQTEPIEITFEDN